ncbi:phage antirepressor KilAC domain-containing protein [Acinetobacter ursingii]|uniref:phage antirepressor KilAC domain-containing protein n=1 Tax=Acinetobacter ursingii TaxID=108980 RepID=UPI00244BCB94|nr:phage antirepressor KilAC domain-containing protein [Acinetobacter ursingii]MDH2019428.1 phage antirepressor KilAC domain-containing protein [Acinetobacter ursingii]MDH2071834.1 phage antirepressor KilAC domain-containing protein [Acinetobacter ursingii]
MNAIAPLQTQSMNSLEISELVQSRPDKVKQSIERLAEKGVITLPPMVETSFLNSIGRKQNTTVYLFTGEQGKRDSIIVVAQLCPEFTARLVDRWQELEAQVAKPIDPMQALSDPNILRGLLLGYSEKMVELEQKVEVMQPTVEAFDRIAKADGSFCLRDTANNLQMRQSDLIKWLHLNNWIYKRVGNAAWHGYSDKLQAGYLEHKTEMITRPDGSEKITEQVRVTPKGLTRLSKLLGNNHV